MQAFPFMEPWLFQCASGRVIHACAFSMHDVPAC